MLSLVFSKDEQVQKTVVETYREIYFHEGALAQAKVNALWALVHDSSLTELKCLEELLAKLVKQNCL